jgi:hypothetical protein
MRPPHDEPDLLVVEPALAAPLEFAFAGHQGAEDGWQGRRITGYAALTACGARA